MKIEAIVKVDITRETTSKTIRDLQTTAILTQHEVFAEDSRVYSGTDEMIEDGFETTDAAYIAASRIFAQNPRPRTIIVGKRTTTDYVAEINKLVASNPNWVFLLTDASTDAEKIAIAEYVETQDIIYITSTTDAEVLNPASTTDLAATLASRAYAHTILLHRKVLGDAAPEVIPEAAYVGRHSTVTIGSNLWGYKTLVGLDAQNYTSTEIAALKAKNTQFYTKVGADSVIAGDMNAVGGEKIHVILGALWLKIRIGEALWNLLYTNERILYTVQGASLFQAELYRVLSEGVQNNILTDDTPFQISMPDVNKLTSQQRATGILSNIKFRARLAGAIIYVDGVQGTVYA